ncbi:MULTISPECIES: methyltransferase domain-containing protein [Catenuloplanes]|uniref:23S rRNA G2445 N2-methylase RlmL n=1 Tax=Catenuloplanes niger TaxID=587534 RepID=A0AAE4CW73_9ACTN|nr:methyltransferase domain-containing protein [Catenuloplanes niger]MDR7325213.1 23S rRNA G2445 N2-methylase RlmL [Catenuloplanes niger]
MAVRLLARTLRGLEEVAAAEVTGRGLGRVDRSRHREVWFTADRADPHLLDLRTVDDLFLLAASVDDVGHTKADLARFTAAARAVDPGELLRQRALLGFGAAATGVDVAASFLGKRNYNRYDIEDAAGLELARATGLPYHSRRGGDAPPEGTLSFRVTVEGTRAALALRAGDRPLHRRSYKQASTPGTLHPPLAAAMALLADIRPADTVLDPCCGTGTILIEAAGLVPGARLIGMDHDPRALAAATANAALTETDATWLRGDAARLPIGTGRIDRVVSNPPWDRQVPARGTLAGRPTRLYREIRRVLPAGGRAVLLLHEAEEQLTAVKAAELRVREVRPLSLFGSHPSIVTLTG